MAPFSPLARLPQKSSPQARDCEQSAVWGIGLSIAVTNPRPLGTGMTLKMLAAYQGAAAGGALRQAERSHQQIIGTGFKRFNSIDFFGGGAEQQHRHRRGSGVGLIEQAFDAVVTDDVGDK
jgi:hypothetical protein